MKFCVIAGLVFVVISAPVSRAFGALDIQFSLKEGYPAALSQLNGTPAKDPVWRVAPGDGFLVNGTKKFASANPASDSGTALLTAPIPIEAGGTVTVSVDFEFAGVDLMTPLTEVGIQVPGIGLGASATEFYKGAINVLLGHYPWSDSEYAMQLHPGGQPVGFSAGDLGIEEANDSSDRLRLVIKITKGDGPDGWGCEVSLLNTTTDVLVATISTFDVSLPKDVFESPNLYLNLNRGSSPKDHGPAAVKFFAIKAGKET